MMAAIEARLRDQVPALRTIGGAGDLAALEKSGLPPREKLPAAYVQPMEDEGGPNRMATGVIRQDITRRVAIVLLTTDARDARGELAAEGLEPLYLAVRTALVGWTPPVPAPPASGVRLLDPQPMEFRTGSMMEIKAGNLWWGEEYSSRCILSSLA